MSDTPTTPSSSSFTDKAAKAALVGAAFAGAAAILPQDELVKEGLPAFWDAVKGIFEGGWETARNWHKRARPIVFQWLEKLWSVLKWWILLSAALVVAGIEVKTRTGSNVGHVLVAGGTLSFCALGILLFALTDGIAAILYLKFRILGGVFGKIASKAGIDFSRPVPPTPADAKQVETFRDRVRLVLAGTVVLCFSLLFTLFFPAYSTLGWTMCFWAMVGVALAAALYLNLKMGKAVQALFYATIGLIVITFVVFLLDRLTGGALKFGSFQKWLLALNASKIITVLFALIVLTLLVVSAFAGKERQAAFQKSAKYVGLTLLVTWIGLLYAGTITWKGIWSKDPPKAVQEVGETIQNGSLKDLGSSKPSAASAAPSRASHGSGGTYLPPPSGSSGPSRDVPAPRASKPRAKKQPLPPLKAKTYESADSAISDLESLL